MHGVACGGPELFRGVLARHTGKNVNITTTWFKYWPFPEPPAEKIDTVADYFAGYIEGTAGIHKLASSHSSRAKMGRVTIMTLLALCVLRKTRTEKIPRNIICRS